MSPDTELITIGEDVITPTKRRGRPKGSKNKNTDIVNDTEAPAAVELFEYSSNDEYVTIRLQSEQVPNGLEATVSRYIAVAVSALPNGNASVITNIGSAQPLILVTVEPYLDVRNRFFPVLK